MEATLDEDIDHVLDLNIGEAEDAVPSSGIGTTTYLTSSTSSSSLDWLHICKKKPINNDPFESSSNLSRADGGFHAFNKDPRMSPDLRDHEESVMDPFSRSKNLQEVSANILRCYELEKDDLDQLMFYSEDQIPSESLRVILEKISIEKKKKTTSGVQSEPPLKTSLSVMDRLGCVEGAEMVQEELSSAGPKANEGAYFEPVGESSGNRNVFLLDSTKTRNPSGEPPQRTIQVEISGLDSLWDQMGSDTGLGSVALSAGDPAEPTQSNPDSQAVLPSLSLGNQDQNPIKFMIPSKKSKAVGLLGSETQPSNSQLHSSGSGSPELISSNDDSCTEVQRQESKVPLDQLYSTPPRSQTTWPHVNPPEPKTVSVQNIVVLPQPIQAPENPVQVLRPPSSRESPAEGDISEGLPTPAVMEDPTRATPVRFLH